MDECATSPQIFIHVRLQIFNHYVLSIHSLKKLQNFLRFVEFSKFFTHL